MAMQRYNDCYLAEEAVQETILKLLKYPNTLIEASKKSPADEKNYVSRAAENVINDILRKRSKNSQIWYSYDVADTEQIHDTHEYANPEKYVISNDSKNILQEAIGKLDRKYRTPFLLQRSNGLTIKQIADITGTSTSSVTKHIAKAKSILKQSLERVDKDNE